MADGDFYKLLVKGQQAGGDEILNIFWYKLIEVTALPPLTEFEICQELCEWFSTNVITPWLDIVSEDFSFVELEARQHLGIAFYNLPYVPVAPGLVASEALPRFVSYNVLLQRSTLATRHGHKRVAGVPEAWQDNGNFTGDNTKMGDFTDAVAMDATIPGGTSGSLLFTPYIVRLNPDTQAVIAENAISSVRFQGFGTQNSRK